MPAELRPRKSLSERIRSIRPIRLFIDNAFRIEDALKRTRSRLARKRGHLESVEPFTGYGTTAWLRVFARVQMVPAAQRRMPQRTLRQLLRFGRRRREQAVRGWRSFVRATAVDARLTVRANGVDYPITADRGGVVDTIIPSSLSPGWHTVELESSDGQISQAPVHVFADNQRVGIVSDVDDTVMVTALPRPLLAAWNTFVLDEHARVAVPGMNVLYQRLTQRYDAPLLYLSTGSWNVAPTLARFLGRNLYPAGPMLLTDWGPTPQRLFRSGTEHKRGNLRRLAREFPDMKWILIGDDGQHDESIFGEFVRDNPHSVLAVAIRQLSNTESVLAGGRAASSARWRQHSVPWVFGPDGSVLADELARIGILDTVNASDLTELSDSLVEHRLAVPYPPAEPSPS